MFARLLDALVRGQVALQFARTRLRQAGYFRRHTPVEITAALWAALDALSLSLHPPDIGLDLLDIGLLLVPGSRLQLALVRARCGEVAVVPWVALHRARIRIDIEDARHRAVQELAVVRDD